MQAHQTGSDVIMAYRLTITYLRRALKIPLPGKMDVLLSSASKTRETGWHICDKDASEFLERLQQTPLSVICQNPGSVNKETNKSEDEEEEEHEDDNMYQILGDDEGEGEGEYGDEMSEMQGDVGTGSAQQCRHEGERSGTLKGDFMIMASRIQDVKIPR